MTASAPIKVSRIYFNSHPHEEDDGISQWKFNGINISTHILTKRMTSGFNYLDKLKDISTHILTKRMTARAWAAVRTSSFQLTSSRRGWRGDWNQNHGIEISTHILTKRMTVVLLVLVFILVFQLTSSRRGWRFRKRSTNVFKYFNSHPHEEDDSNFKQK